MALSEYDYYGLQTTRPDPRTWPGQITPDQEREPWTWRDLAALAAVLLLLAALGPPAAPVSPSNTTTEAP